EHLELVSDTKIGMRFRAGDQILLAVIEAYSKVRRIVCFEALPEIATERQVGLGIVCGERDILEAVKRFPGHAWIGEPRPILLPAVEPDRGPRRCVGPAVAILCLNRPGGKDRDGCDELHSPPPTWHADRGPIWLSMQHLECLRRSCILKAAHHPYRNCRSRRHRGVNGSHDIHRKFSTRSR